MDKVLCYALNEWLQDIRKNQLPGLLGGVGPMHSVVQLCECPPAFENSVLFVWDLLQNKHRSGEARKAPSNGQGPRGD